MLSVGRGLDAGVSLTAEVQPLPYALGGLDSDAR